MLKHLSIKNYALIDELAVDFSRGLNIITGETGAGKSILLGGLALVLGKRADLGQIKDRNKKCIVEALISIAGYEIKSLFDFYDLDYDTEVIIRRELLASGKSRAFVNDTPVNLEVLNAITSNLIDIHSQNQTLQLTDDNYLFSVIDGIANNSNRLKDYKEHWNLYRGISKEIENLKLKQSEANRIKDYNNYLLEELNEIKINADQFAELEEKQSQLENTELIQQRLQLSVDLLNDEQFGILERLKELKRSLDDILEFNSAFKQLQQRVLSSVIEIEDLSSEVEYQVENTVADPRQLEEVNDIIQRVNQLLMKHHVQSFDDLVEIKNKLQEEFESTLNIEDRIQANEKEKRRLEGYLNKRANDLTVSRKKSIPNLQKSLEEMLHQLGMPNARFRIKIIPINKLAENGADVLEFKFTANKGSDFKELKLSASGGELSRIMMSLKSILAEHVKLPTLIFDEIDTGVSGDVADKMGEIMKKMSGHFQLLSITHLPQIAAKGDVHFKVFKSDEEDQTYTKIKYLSNEDRIVEIAQMLGGQKMSESAIAHAKQLLN